jgi:hypothetical protein
MTDSSAQLIIFLIGRSIRLTIFFCENISKTNILTFLKSAQIISNFTNLPTIFIPYEVNDWGDEFSQIDELLFG